MHPGLLPELLVVSSLTLLVAQAVPTVRIPNGNGTRLVAAVGKTVELECVVTGIDGIKDVQLRWQYVGDFSINPVILNSTGYYTVTEVVQSRNRRVITLQTAAVRYEYEGYYYCHLLTPENDYTDYVELRVEGAPTFDLNQTTPPGELASTLQDSMDIVCTVKARPGAEIEWFMNGTQLYSSARGYTISTTVPLVDIVTSSTLSVFPLTQEQLGTYTCVAKNARGQVRRQWWVTAAPRLSVVTPENNGTRVNLGDELTVQCKGVNLGNAGKITWSFSSNGAAWTTLTGGNIVAWTDAMGAINSQLSVTYSYYSNQGIYRCSWLKVSQSVVIRIVGGWVNVVIPSVHHGIYRCSWLKVSQSVVIRIVVSIKASTGVPGSKVSQSVVIRIVGPPVVTLSTTTVTALPGDAVTLTCRVNANPRPTTLGWFYKNQELRNSTKYTLYRTYITGALYSQTTLTINQMEETDYGSKYKCVAGNDEGRDTANVTLRDVNECVTGEATCDWGQHEICVDTLGSYECHCATGFDRRGGTCTATTAAPVDVNQCKVDHQCDQTCVNYFGSFRCECMVDFLLQADMVTCLPVSSVMGSSTQPPAANTGGNNVVAIGLGVGITVVIVAIVVVIVVIVCRRRGNRERELIDIPKPKPSPTSGFYNSAYSVNDDEAHIYSELSPTGDEFPRGRLRFLNSLGEGKFGRVVMAEALSISKTGKWEEVAVKMVKETATDAMKEDFYHELTIVRKLPTHPNVVAYLGCVTASDPALMVMEYVNGGDLLTYLRKRRPEKTTEQTPKEESFVTPKDMLSFALQIARGMAHVAAQKIIHRDVAARNVLIDRKHVCKVSDFGLARDVEGADVYERTNKGPLPIRWMAPESLRDSVHTSKSDVWSFGVLLWEIVTLGSSPYPGMSGQQVMTSVLEGKKLVCPPQCNKDLYAIMSRCWNDSDTSRPTFDILSRDFERILEDEGDYIQLNQMEEGIYQVLEGVRSEEKL
ncbi:fibroblast growth factor receptor 3-like [Haliotis rubra]|uniref:fibroblast growth factor receptor 3-like n=1 Tax=Haliotis rubra TaxID=36100 RepID=UPI001EE5C655|nr:fibroblast growth factor receptor 3-like [Haliotis rubra]